MLYDFAPWHTALPRDLASYYNPLQSDWATQFQPWIMFARGAFHDGVFPAWNPYSIGGAPFWANGQASLLNPLSLPYWLLPLPFAYGAAAWLHLVIAALGMYALVRALGANFPGGVVAGTAYSFGAYHVMWLSAPPLVTPFTFLPVMLWRTERLVQRGESADGAWLALACGACFLSGHPGNSALAVLAVVVYAGVRLLAGPAARKRTVAAWGLAALAAGAALSAAVTLPAALLVPGSAGEVARAGGGLSYAFESLRTLWFPEWWGISAQARELAARVAASDNIKEICFYGGSAGLILAALSATSQRFRRACLAPATLIVLGTDLVLGGPLRALLTSVPPYDHINVSRGIGLVSVGLAMLAGLGVTRVIEQPPSTRTLAKALGAVATSGVVVLLLSQPGHFVDALLGKRDAPLPPPNSDSVRSVAVWAGLTIATGGLLLAARRVRPAFVAVALVALVALDAGMFAQRGFRYFAPSAQAFPPPTAGIKWLQAHANGGRMAAPQTTLPPNSQMAYGIASVQGYEAPEPDMRFFRLWQRIFPDQLEIQPLVVPGLGADQRRLVDVLGGRWLVTPASAPPVAIRGGIGVVVTSAIPGTTRVYDGSDLRIFDNHRALPRVFVPAAVRLVAGEAAARDALFAPKFRPLHEVIVESAAAHAGRGRAVITHEENSAVELRAVMERGGVVVLNDRLKPGWSVTVDGRPASELRVNSVMRGVDVPAGTHRVRWSYRVPGLRAGTALSLLALVAILAWLGLARRQRRYQNDAFSMTPSASSSSSVLL